MAKLRAMFEWSSANPAAAIFCGLFILTAISFLKMILVPAFRKHEILMYARRAERAGFGGEFVEEMNHAIAAFPSTAHLGARPLYMHLRQRHQDACEEALPAKAATVLPFCKRT